MEGLLLIDCCVGTSMDCVLTESTAKGLVKFRGKFQEAYAINKNKRMYPFSVIAENVKKLQETIKRRGLIGECDHPSDSIIHYASASHLITKLEWEGKTLIGEGEILPTPNGMILKTLIEAGVPIGISSRGVGNGTTNEDGILVIGESYKLITFDAVADPSTFQAFQEKVVQAQKPKNEQIFSTKNETSNIYNINKEAFIACMGGVIKEKTQLLKERLS